MRRWGILCWIVLYGVVVAATACAAQPKTVLLVGQSRDNHPPGTHEYMSGVNQVAKLLETAPEVRLQVVKADEPWAEGPALLSEADSVVLFLSEGARWLQADPRRHEAFVRLAARGGGLVALHWAIGTRAAEPIEPFLKLFGGCHGGPDRKYQVVEADVKVPDPSHPIASELKDFRIRDEFYYQLKFARPPAAIRPILQAILDGQPETIAWAYQRPDGGRSFGFSGLHFDDNWQRPEYRRLIGNAVLWTLGKPSK
jgi:hypothetical protein